MTNRILALPIFAAVMFLVLAIGGWSVSIGAATDWADDGLFGSGWFLPFSGSDGEGYDEAAGAFEEASAVIEAYGGGESAAYLYDAGAGEVRALEVTPERCAEALAIEESDPAGYGAWVPGLPVLAESLLNAMGVGGALAVRSLWKSHRSGGGCHGDCASCGGRGGFRSPKAAGRQSR